MYIIIYVGKIGITSDPHIYFNIHLIYGTTTFIKTVKKIMLVIMVPFFNCMLTIDRSLNFYYFDLEYVGKFCEQVSLGDTTTCPPFEQI